LGVVKLCDFGFARLMAAPGNVYKQFSHHLFGKLTLTETFINLAINYAYGFH